jgi:bifunctional UDP-N-acetylglucosamine pyrophosphorylase/glucosamine-1-phosphate N-acetyltransferase/UDP-N-acetylglucosamine pyrophosphorylase
MNVRIQPAYSARPTNKIRRASAVWLNRKFVGIVEEKDATPEQKRVTEVNLSTYVFNCRDLLAALEQIRADNAQREYYLTDCPTVLLKAGKDVRALDVLQPCEALSINNLDELRDVEIEMQRMKSATTS